LSVAWLRERVWQLGIAIALALAGAVIIYLAGAGEADVTLLWLGLGLFFAGMAIPLLIKLYGVTQGEEDEEEES
jgi:hypothetical protein